MFTLHSNVLQNVIIDALPGSNAITVSPVARYLNNTSVFMGKYLGNNMVTKLPDWAFKQKEAYKALCAQVGTANLKGFGFEEDDPALTSGGALLSYLDDTARATLGQITGYQKVEQDKFLHIDESSRRNLELLANQQDGSTRMTLFSSIDQTLTSGGTRMIGLFSASLICLTRMLIVRSEEVLCLGGMRKVGTIISETSIPCSNCPILG